MDTYILQSNLPQRFIRKSIVLVQDNFIYRGWYYEEAKELVEWLKSKNYIVETIQLCLTKGSKIRFVNNGWDYRGDKTKSKEDNITHNYQSALLFIENNQPKNNKNMAYEIFFESENYMDEIDKLFYYKSIISSGYNYDSEVALEFIEKCRIMKKKLLGIDVFRITEKSIQPVDETIYESQIYDNFDPAKYFEIFHIEKNADVGHWKEADQFVKEHANPDIYFQISYES